MNQHKRNSLLLLDYSSGISLRELASKYGITKQRMYQIFDELDEESKKAYQKEHSRNVMIRRFPEGFRDTKAIQEFLFFTRAISLAQLSRKLGVTMSTVSKLRAEFGISSEYRWNKEMVIYALRYLHHNDESLTSTDLQATHRNLYQAAVRLFGKYDAALKEAGVFFTDEKPRKQRSKYTKKIVLERIADLHEKGEDLSAGESMKKLGYLHAQARKFFNKEARRTNKSTWEVAITKAGLDYSKIRKRPYGGRKRATVRQSK
jgi:hypothetical protein